MDSELNAFMQMLSQEANDPVGTGMALNPAKKVRLQLLRTLSNNSSMTWLKASSRKSCSSEKKSSGKTGITDIEGTPKRGTRSRHYHGSQGNDLRED